MNKIIVLSFFVLTTSAWTQVAKTPALTTEEEIQDDRRLDHYKSHWLVSFGFETIQYEVPFDYRGARESFQPGEQALMGGRIGFGHQFHLGKGFITTSKLESFYMGTLFERAIDAAPEEETEEFSFTKKTGQIYGAEIIQSIGYIFHMKTKNPFLDEMTYLTVEPFIEAGIGRAWAYNRRNYNYDTGPSGVQEDYKLRVTDEIMSQRLGIGVNFTSNQGYFLYLKASQHNFDILKRKVDGTSQVDDQVRVDLSNSDVKVDMDPVMIYAVGGGYKF